MHHRGGQPVRQSPLVQCQLAVTGQSRQPPAAHGRVPQGDGVPHQLVEVSVDPGDAEQLGRVSGDTEGA